MGLPETDSAAGAMSERAESNGTPQAAFTGTISASSITRTEERPAHPSRNIANMGCQWAGMVGGLIAGRSCRQPIGAGSELRVTRVADALA